jgi:hypothetical protein
MQIKRLRSSREWHEYFTNNRERLDLLTRETEIRIANCERRAVVKSLQAFQLGESSEGLHLYHCAEQHAEETGDLEYLDAVRLFIREEQRHAQYLARFMKFAHIPLARQIFIDSVFRKLRKLAGLECSVSILIIAEIIAKVFYRALRNATRSEFLQAICDQILSDEEMHVQFQAERLAILRKGRHRIVLVVTNAIHRFLFAGTVLVVWMKCRSTLLAGHYTVIHFFRDCWEELNSAIRLMDPRSYGDVLETTAISVTLKDPIEP